MSKFMNVSDEVKKLDMEFHYGDLKVITGESFCVSVDGEEEEQIIIEENGDTLKIYDQRKSKRITSKHLFFGKNIELDGCDITITIPEVKVFDRVSLRTGAVEVRATELMTAILALEMGAGDVEINHLEVTNYGKISSGAGEVAINSGCLNDMTMSFGVGEADIRAKLTGESKISTGVGELSLVLQGTSSDYCIIASKGIGSCHIDGFDVSGNDAYGTGTNKINVSGGIGAISIRLEETTI